MAETNPLVRVVVHDTRLDNDNVMDIFDQYDLIIDGTDNFARHLERSRASFSASPTSGARFTASTW